jgi:hypothetical protein
MHNRKHTTNNKSKMRLLAVAVAEKETIKQNGSSKSKRRTERGELEKKGWNS